MSNVKEKSGSLPPCAICRAKVAIYRCPRCHTCTCSLECCRAHKAGTKEGGNGGAPACSGKRDRTEFCSLRGFTDSQLASDYHFLEDVLKVSESSKRLYHGIANGDASAAASSGPIPKRVKNNHQSGRLKLGSISTKPPAHPLLRAKEGKSVVEVLAHGVHDMQTETDETQLPHRGNGIVKELLTSKPSAKPMSQNKKEKIDPLVRQAELKGVNLLRMPNGMQRRRSNTTKFSKKKGVITWKVELCFHQPEGSSDEVKGESCGSGEKTSSSPRMLKVECETMESSTLAEELGKHLDVHPGNSSTRTQLRTFATVPRDSLAFFMKRLPCSSAAPQYFRLDPDVALTETLNGKTIIEFPTIDVAMEADKGRFPLFIGEMA